jgi:hypothetical protein
MALNMIVEALFRVNVRLHSGNIIKRSSPEIGEGPIVLRYKMLDQHELCSDETLDRLVESVEPASRELAKKALTLAVKVRDAVAHGAVPTLEQDDVEMGHLLVKSIQCLVEAGEHEMIKTAAYYEWQVRPERDALSNWLAGEQQILDQIQSRTRQEGATVSCSNDLSAVRDGTLVWHSYVSGIRQIVILPSRVAECVNG